MDIGMANPNAVGIDRTPNDNDLEIANLVHRALAAVQDAGRFGDRSSLLPALAQQRRSRLVRTDASSHRRQLRRRAALLAVGLLLDIGDHAVELALGQPRVRPQAFNEIIDRAPDVLEVLGDAGGM